MKPFKLRALFLSLLATTTSYVFADTYAYLPTMDSSGKVSIQVYDVSLPLSAQSLPVQTVALPNTTYNKLPIGISVTQGGSPILIADGQHTLYTLTGGGVHSTVYQAMPLQGAAAIDSVATIVAFARYTSAMVGDASTGNIYVGASASDGVTFGFLAPVTLSKEAAVNFIPVSNGTTYTIDQTFFALTNKSNLYSLNTSAGQPPPPFIIPPQLYSPSIQNITAIGGEDNPIPYGFLCATNINPPKSGGTLSVIFPGDPPIQQGIADYNPEGVACNGTMISYNAVSINAYVVASPPASTSPQPEYLYTYQTDQFGHFQLSPLATPLQFNSNNPNSSPTNIAVSPDGNTVCVPPGSGSSTYYVIQNINSGSPTVVQLTPPAGQTFIPEQGNFVG